MQIVSTVIIVQAVDNGCHFLSLGGCNVDDTLSLTKMSQLKHIDLLASRVKGGWKNW